MRLREMTSLTGDFAFLRSPGAWFWAAALAGAAGRFYLALFTPGTYDVSIWEVHAREVAERGMLHVYANGTHQLNHPPFVTWLLARGWELAQWSGVPFSAILRLPFGVVDLASAWLLIRILEGSPSRYLISALYLLHPLSLIYASYHGNTDSSVAFFLLASMLCVLRGRALAAGAILGLSFWLKLPGTLAAPVLLLALPSWGERLRFAGAAALVGIASYLPVLFADPGLIVRSVFLYSGLNIITTAGTHIWGIQVFYPDLSSWTAVERYEFRQIAAAWDRYNRLLCAGLILLIAWCRQGDRSARGIAQGVTASYVIVYGLTNYWAFQYFAWSLPFWLLSGWRFALPASLFATAYVWGLYAWLTGHPLLLGEWDFIGHPHWPDWLLFARNAALLFFVGAAVLWIGGAVRLALGPREPLRSGSQRSGSGDR